MESNGSSSKTNQNHSSDSASDATKEKSSEKDVFVNHDVKKDVANLDVKKGLSNLSDTIQGTGLTLILSAEIAWHQMRKEWVGNQSEKLQRPPKDSIMSLTTSYEDLLLSTEPFPHPIPLAEMVDFLVDFWHEGGLYD